MQIWVPDVTAEVSPKRRTGGRARWPPARPAENDQAFMDAVSKCRRSEARRDLDCLGRRRVHRQASPNISWAGPGFFSQPEVDRTFRLAAIEVVDEDCLYFLGH